jgi:hypothetical protein
MRNQGIGELSCPTCPPREVHFALDIGQTIFFVRGIFKTILLPNLSDRNAIERIVLGI